MRNSWIKVVEGLPYLHTVSNTWLMSSPVLITSKDRIVYVANLQLYDENYEWIVGEYKQPLDFVTEWQTIELSDPNPSELQRELRATQNYHLNT